MQGRPFGENEGERVRVEFRELGGGRFVPKLAHQVQRRAEGALERHLLVEQHGDQQGQRAAGQQLVGLRLNRHPDRHCVLPGCHDHGSRSLMPQRTPPPEIRCRDDPPEVLRHYKLKEAGVAGGPRPGIDERESA